MKFRPALLSLLLLAAPAAAQAPSARDELLRLVPDDAALCLVVTDLRTQGDKLMQSPWVKALKDAPFAKALGDSPEMLKLSAVQKLILSRLQVDWPTLRDEILGDAVVFAYRPALPGQPEKEGGILLLRARSPEVLAKLIDRLNDEQKKAGELKELKPREHQGVKYVQRVEISGDQFYYLDGGLLAFSGQEAMLQKMLERKADPKKEPLPLVKELAEIGCDKALASVWLNPRAFDALLQAQAEDLGNTPEGKSLRTFLGYWKALEGVSLSVLVDRKEPELVVAVHALKAKLPAPAAKLVTELAKPSDVWSRLPKDSVVAFAARTDFEALLETFEQLWPGDEDGLADFLQQTLGVPLDREVFKELAPRLGPDVGFCVARPEDKTSFPHILFAVRIHDKPGDDDYGPVLVKTLRLAVESLVVKDYNRKHKDQIALKTEVQGGVEVHYLTNDAKFPKGFRPAFALKDGYLVVASSPEALARFAKQAETPAADKVCPLMKLSFKQLSALVKERKDTIVTLLAEKRKLQAAAAAKRFETLVWGLDLFDSAELVQRTDGDRVAWVFRVRTAGK
jgi:hypothetical protein